MRILAAALLVVALPAFAQPGPDDFPLRIEIAPVDGRPTALVSWAPGADGYVCAAEISFGSGSRNGPFIALTPTDDGCTGSGPMPPPAQLRVVRLRAGDGVLIVRMEGPPTNAGWEEGVAAARFHYENEHADDAEGETAVWIRPAERGFNIGMPPTVAGIHLGDLITE